MDLVFHFLLGHKVEVFIVTVTPQIERLSDHPGIDCVKNSWFDIKFPKFGDNRRMFFEIKAVQCKNGPMPWKIA